MIIEDFFSAVGLAWSYDPESYASIPTGRVFHAGQDKGDDPDKKGYSNLPGWGVERGVSNPTP
jgi:hypothetical protein